MTSLQSPIPETAPRGRRAKTRPALIQAGVKLLAARPVDSLSIDEIVEAAKVAKGSFFYHFADKQSFAREISADVRIEVEATIAEVNRGVTDSAVRVARARRVIRPTAATPRSGRRTTARRIDIRRIL